MSSQIKSLQLKLKAYSSRSSSLRLLRRERVDAEDMADSYRVQLKAAKTKLNQALRRYGVCGG